MGDIELLGQVTTNPLESCGKLSTKLNLGNICIAACTCLFIYLTF